MIISDLFIYPVRKPPLPLTPPSPHWGEGGVRGGI